jgi:soluble lytic murein transglycosylase
LCKEHFIKVIVLVLLAIFILAFAVGDFDLWTIRRNFEQIKYQAEIQKYAERFEIEKELLAALIYVESRFNNYSESSKGAVGLMQLMPSTAIWIAEELDYNNFQLKDLNNPEINIKFGSWYFAYLYEKFDRDLIKTIAAYNAGENNVRIWINNGWQGNINEKLPFKETDDFVRRVISTKKYYKENMVKLYNYPTINLSLFRPAD